MAYAQWIKVTIKSRNLDISIKNARLGFGKFYADDNKESSIRDEEINSIVVHNGESKAINACSRLDSTNGTQGSFDLYDGGTKIGTFQWNNPWGSPSNQFNLNIGNKTTYITQINGGNIYSGPIGNVDILILKI